MSRVPVRSNPLRDFMRAVQHFGRGQHQPWRVFADFCELAALALAQVPLKCPEREARYLKVVGAYERDEAVTFGQMLGMVVMGLEREPCDFLGDAFQRLELSNHWHGQFFTPVHLARLMADLTFDEAWLSQEFITVHDPACGAGVTLLATAQALLARGINPQQRLHITGQDVDPTAAYMAYVQLALSGLPATVIVGNTLTMEVREVWHTPAHHLGFWGLKLRRCETLKPVEVAPPAPVPNKRGQYALPLGERAA